MCNKCKYCGVLLIGDYKLALSRVDSEGERKALVELAGRDEEVAGLWSCTCPCCGRGGCADCA